MYHTKIHIEKETALICLSKISMKKIEKGGRFVVRVCVYVTF